MKPKPLSSLNHLTVPVAMSYLHGVCAANADDAMATNCGRVHYFYPGHADPVERATR
jgi:hypothetical protein